MGPRQVKVARVPQEAPYAVRHDRIESKQVVVYNTVHPPVILVVVIDIHSIYHVVGVVVVVDDIHNISLNRKMETKYMFLKASITISW